MFARLFGRKSAPFITVVSGLPRSGTSMMMKMLEVGGIAPLIDGVRSADADNPKGYYEFERVKKLPNGDVSWLPSAQGKAVKIITALLIHLPADYHYRVLFMRRNLDELLASQARMLRHRGEVSAADDEKMKQLYAQHLQQIEKWIEQHPQIEVLDVDYTELVQNPMGQLTQINSFLGGKLDLPAMFREADPALYRNRKND